MVYSLTFYDNNGSLIASIGTAGNTIFKEIALAENERIVGVKTRCGNN